MTFKYSTFTFITSRVVVKLGIYLKTITNLPFITTKRRHIHRHLRIVISFQRVAYLVKNECQYNNISNKVFAETKKIKRKDFSISEAELLMFDCVNLFYLRGQCMTQFWLIYVFRHIEFRLVQITLKLIFFKVKRSSRLQNFKLYSYHFHWLKHLHDPLIDLNLHFQWIWTTCKGKHAK